ncbi:OSCP, subunit 5 of the stator stalk of mitochondrial F1F0 ATP synthase [Rhodofomes roseus]|uniref:OSCP, subunit 5 of the stator stalk of mitochondrial F1F0 ATP synthase n=1 Tax=Rhodofomes roseus TaxID=34475 RepID=A0ABQ8JXC1_9APHY|nr:OSCP, subunit 5 of the stator stalk of mitochondrial F1F0 ATP synthase [Rhodofomes roseus]KAH9828724.1 OSCP, subunit 5 of the stator stalk of mitochondrial F1F0 ATP synthase [Rhodofomes roseus]
MLLYPARAVTASTGLGRRAASSLALKFPNAVFNAVLHKSPQTLNKVQSELIDLSSAIESVPELNAFVSNTTLSTNDCVSGLNALYATAEIPKKEPNGHLAEAHGVIEGFNKLVSQYKGELTVTITSAAPLPSDIQRKLESSLKQSRELPRRMLPLLLSPLLMDGFITFVGNKRSNTILSGSFR